MIFDLTFFTNGVLWMAYYCTIKIDIGLTLGVSYIIFVVLDSIYIKRKFQDTRKNFPIMIILN